MNLYDQVKAYQALGIGGVMTDGNQLYLPAGVEPLAESVLLAKHLELVEAERIKGIQARAQAVKNASLGNTPEQLAETLKTQVNMGIGGLLLLVRQTQIAVGGMLISSNICSVQQWEGMLEASLTPEQHAIVEAGMRYWTWVQQVDAHVAALIANPQLAENFPPAPTL